MKKRGAKWRFKDFLVPLLALPFAFVAIFILENGFNVYALLFLIAAFFIYLPILIVSSERLLK